MKGKSIETSSLFIVLVVSRVMLDSIAQFVSNSATAAYINVLLCTAFALGAVFVINKTSKGRNLREILTNAYGKRVYLALYSVLLIFTLICASRRLVLSAEPIYKYILRDSPKLFVYLLFLPVIIYAALCGTRVISGYAYVVVIASAVILAIIVLMSAGEAKFINLCPILGKGDFSNVFNMLYVFSDVLYFYLLSDNTKPKREKSIYAVILTGGLLATLLTTLFTLCIPYPASLNAIYPVYTLASLANSSVLLQRLDGLVFILWIFTGMISVSALTLFGVLIFKEIFNITEAKGVCGAVAFAVFALSLWGMDLEFIDTIMWVSAFVVLPFSSVFGTLVGTFRKSKSQ